MSGTATARHDWRLVPAAVIGWGVTAALVEQPSTVSIAVAATAAVLTGAAMLSERSRTTALGMAACCMAALAASCAWRLAAVESSPLTTAADQGRVGSFVLTVTRDAQVFALRGEPQAVVEVSVDRVRLGDREVRDAGRATAFVSGVSDDLVVGRRFEATARTAPADSSREVAQLDVVRRGHAAPGAWWWESAERLREGVRAAVEPRPEAPRALLPALVDGDDGRVDDRLEEDFRRSGLTHLMAVSGTNVTIVLGVSLGICRLVGLRRRALWAVGVLTLIGFVLLARPDPSVVRAAAMGLVGVAAIGFGRGAGVRSLAASVLGLLFVDPWWSRSAGFVLSVCATAGIVVLAPPLTARLDRWMPRWVALALAVPLTAQLACTPALTALSGEVSTVAVLANVLAAPAVAPATVLGLLGGLVAVLLPPLGQAVAWPAAWCAGWIIAVAHWCAGLDGAAVSWTVPWAVSLVLTPLLALVVWFASVRPALLLGLALGLLTVTARPPHPGWPPPGWVLVACDVGQGDAAVLRAGDATAVVVDAGPDPPAVGGCLDRLGVEQVPLVVLTHAHADHVDGLPGVRRGRRVGQVVVGPSGARSVPGAGVLLAGRAWRVGEVHAEVVWPVDGRPVVSTDGSVLNDASVVLRVSVRGLTILLTGDIEPDAQDQLLASGAPVAATVLKVAHHGSARQSERFLEAVGPRVATLSAGVDNDYGHPAPRALRMLHRHGVRTWRTDVDGDIALAVHDGRLSVITEK